MVPNEADKDACVCCEAPKPGSAPKKPAAPASNPAFSIQPGGGFKFGSAVTSSTPATSGFTFGGDKSSTTTSVGGFKFGGTPSAEPAVTAPAGFKFGSSVVGEKDDQHQPFKFGEVKTKSGGDEECTSESG
jgi:hypothetical protein